MPTNEDEETTLEEGQEPTKEEASLSREDRFVRFVGSIERYMGAIEAGITQLLDGEGRREMQIAAVRQDLLEKGAEMRDATRAMIEARDDYQRWSRDAWPVRLLKTVLDKAETKNGRWAILTTVGSIISLALAGTLLGPKLLELWQSAP